MRQLQNVFNNFVSLLCTFFCLYPHPYAGDRRPISFEHCAIPTLWGRRVHCPRVEPIKFYVPTEKKSKFFSSISIKQFIIRKIQYFFFRFSTSLLSFAQVICNLIQCKDTYKLAFRETKLESMYTENVGS